MGEPWTKRCPEGHSTIIKREYGYWCESCDRRYAGKPVDAREVDSFPVSGEAVTPAVEKAERRAVLADIIRITDRPTRSAAKARELTEGDGRDIASTLHEMREGGLVEAEGQRRMWWKPTPKGRRAMRGVLDDTGGVEA